MAQNNIMINKCEGDETSENKIKACMFQMGEVAILKLFLFV